MPLVARLNDSILGMTAGEHSGHTLSPHPPVKLTGNISGNTSSNVFCEELPVAHINSTTIEYDSCCGSDVGVVFEGSSSVFVNNIPISRLGDSINPHNGTASISSSCSSVHAN